MGEESVLEQLLPNESVYAEYSKIEDRTELIAVQDTRISEPLFEYLRSVLQSYYSASGGQDTEFLMVSQPRVL